MIYVILLYLNNYGNYLLDKPKQRNISMATNKYKSVRYRDSITGRFITKKEALRRPDTTQQETNRIPRKTKKRRK